MHCPYCKAKLTSLRTKALEEYPDLVRVGYQLSGSRLNTTTEICPSCGQTMQIRRHPVTKAVYLLKREEAYSLDAVRLVNTYLKVCDNPYDFLVSDNIEDKYSAATRIWGVLDRKRRAALRQGDMNTVSKLLLQKARYRCSIGKSFFSIQQDALRYQLRDLEEKGATHVRVVAGHDALVCPHCAEQGGRVFAIAEALQAMPLPVRCDAAGRNRTLENDPGWCRCFYVRQS